MTPRAAFCALILSGCGRLGFDGLSVASSTGGAGDTRVEPDSGSSGSGGATSSVDTGTSGGTANMAGHAGGGGPPARPPPDPLHDPAKDGGGPGGSGSRDGGAPLDAGLIDGAPACALDARALTDWCTEIPELPAPPVIDGTRDCPLELRAIPPAGWAPKDPPDAHAEYAVGWRADGLYLYVEVHDPLVVPAAAMDLPARGDAVELFVDDGPRAGPAPDADGARTFVIAAPATAAPSTRAVVSPLAQGPAPPPLPPTPWTSTEFAAYPTVDGYVVEAFVRAADLGRPSWTLTTGSKVGFDVAIDVSYPTASQTGPDGHRLGQYFLRLAPGPDPEPSRSPAALCNPTLTVP